MRTLIISPHFPPTNAADMQRVRLILPYLKEQGVEVEVLVVDSADVASPVDAWMAAGLPIDIPVHRVRALNLRWTKIPGFGTLGFRALRALRRKGDELLERDQLSVVGCQSSESLKPSEASQQALFSDNGQRTTDNSSSAIQNFSSSSSFDLIYFSTTVFPVHVLGPYWKKKYDVPFVMDYQDPWVSDYYREHPEVVPPGGRLKYAVASWLNRREEPKVLRGCSGITSVSAAYPEQLAKRYPWLKVEVVGRGLSVVGCRLSEKSACCEAPRGIKQADNRQQTTDNRQQTTDNRQQTTDNSLPLPSIILPFPGDIRDFERVKSEGIQQSVFDPKDGLTHWVYVGRGGADMALAVRSLFAALKSSLMSQVSNLKSLRLHFIGTSYAAAGTGMKTIEPLAREYGLEQHVIEHPDRIPYSETLRCLMDADALIVPGSDDPGYTASKIYPYLLAGKPMLAVFHEQSSVVKLIRDVGGAKLVTFATGEDLNTIAARISSEWLGNGGHEQAELLDYSAFAPYTALVQAADLVEFWHHCLANKTQKVSE